MELPIQVLNSMHEARLLLTHFLDLVKLRTQISLYLPKDGFFGCEFPLSHSNFPLQIFAGLLPLPLLAAVSKFFFQLVNFGAQVVVCLPFAAEIGIQGLFFFVTFGRLILERLKLPL